MNTNRNPLVRTLVRQIPLTEKDWIDQIQQLTQLIKPHLSHLTLKTLLDLPVVHTQDCDRRDPQKLSEFTEILLGENDGTQEVREDWLKTQAIFPEQSMRHLNLDYNRNHSFRPTTMDKLFWGLTRAGQWIRVRVALSAKYGEEGINRHEMRMSVSPTSITLWRTDLDTEFFQFIRQTPESVYHELAFSIRQLIQKRKNDLDKLLDLEECIVVASDLLVEISRLQGR